MCLREHNKAQKTKCDSGVVGNARPCQGRDRGFEPRLSLSRTLKEFRVLFLYHIIKHSLLLRHSYFRQYYPKLSSFSLSTWKLLNSVIRKNPACRILRLRRVALSDIYPSAAVRSCPEGFFMSLEHYGVISYDIKNPGFRTLHFPNPGYF